MVNSGRHEGEGPLGEGHGPPDSARGGTRFLPATAMPRDCTCKHSYRLELSSLPARKQQDEEGHSCISCMSLQLRKEDALLRSPQILPPWSPGHCGMSRVCDITAGSEPGPALGVWGGRELCSGSVTGKKVGGRLGP